MSFVADPVKPENRTAISSKHPREPVFRSLPNGKGRRPAITRRLNRVPNDGHPDLSGKAIRSALAAGLRYQRPRKAYSMVFDFQWFLPPKDTCGLPEWSSISWAVLLGLNNLN
jgi:hypothetical protein